MITILAVLNQAATAISTNSAIAAWMTTNFPTKSLTVFLGDDRVDPPSESNAPFVIVAPGMHPYDMGDSAQDRRPVIDVDFAILKTSKTTTGHIVACDGIGLSDALGNLILTALKSSFGAYHVAAANYTLTPIHPLYEGGFTATLLYEGGVGEPSL